MSKDQKCHVLHEQNDSYSGISFLSWLHLMHTRHCFQTVVTSQLGTVNNLIQVRKSDFEVFDALQVDSLDSSDTTGQS